MNQYLNSAKSALQSGDINSARQSIHKIKGYENNPETLYLLALCHAIKNEYIDAEKLFTRTISQSQPTDVILTNLGLSQLHQKKTNEAIQSFLAAIKLNPVYYDALANLASCYDYINDNSAAFKYANKANKLNKNNPAIINIIAKHAFTANKLKDAITLFNKSLQLQPNQIQVYVLLSNAYLLEKNYSTAESIIKKGLDLLPDHPFLINSLGNFYASRNRHKEAISQFDKVLAKNKKNTVSIAAKAHSLIALQKFDRAYNILTDAYRLYPDSPEIIAELSHYYILNKNYESAYEITNRFIASLNSNTPPPANIVLAYSTSCQHTERMEEAKITLESVITKNIYPVEMLELLNFSYADILDKLQDYKNAFKHYQYANKILPRPSDINYYENILDDIANTIDRDFLDKVGTSGNATTLPIFIIGMPRSGTSLVEQIISKHPDTYAAGELTDLWRIGNDISGAMNLINYTNKFSTLSHKKLVEYSDRYLDAIQKLADGKIRVTDKLPHNFMHIGLIECLFPQAKIIHCQRHPFDTCLSIYFKQFNDNHVYARNLEELARFYKKYMILMQHWYRNSSLSILTINYEDMVHQQKIESKKIIDHIGLDWSDDILNYYDSDRIIMTPSYHQASKPIYTSSVNRWKHYSQYLEPLKKVLGEPEQYL